MTQSRPFTVIASYRMLPASQGQWRIRWQELGKRARRLPTCRDFRLLCDPHNRGHCAVFSEWDNASAFHRFVREVGLTWIERDMPHPYGPPEYISFEAISDDSIQPVQVETIEKVPVLASSVAVR